MSKQINIIFYTNWASPSKYLDEIKIYTHSGNGVWQGEHFTLIGVTDPANADYYIILDDGQPSALQLDDRKKIFLKREPDCVRRLKIDPSNYLYVGTFDKLPLASTPWILKPYKFLKELTYIPREKILVVVCSGKIDTSAHRQRLECVKYLTQHLPQGVLDVYGKGLNPKMFNGCYRGEIKGKCKFDVLSRYRFSLALENFHHINHMSEKLFDSYLALTIPIYWGAPNVEIYYPNNSLHLIDIYKPSEALKTVLEVIKTPITQDTIGVMYKARDLTLDKYNIWPIIEDIVCNKLENFNEKC